MNNTPMPSPNPLKVASFWDDLFEDDEPSPDIALQPDALGLQSQLVLDKQVPPWSLIVCAYFIIFVAPSFPMVISNHILEMLLSLML